MVWFLVFAQYSICRGSFFSGLVDVGKAMARMSSFSQVTTFFLFSRILLSPSVAAVATAVSSIILLSPPKRIVPFGAPFLLHHPLHLT